MIANLTQVSLVSIRSQLERAVLSAFSCSEVPTFIGYVWFQSGLARIWLDYKSEVLFYQNPGIPNLLLDRFFNLLPGRIRRIMTSSFSNQTGGKVDGNEAVFYFLEKRVQKPQRSFDLLQLMSL